MKQKISIFFILFPLLLHAKSELSTIKTVGENLYISTQIDANQTMNYWFKRCMANDIYTFYRIALVPKSGNTLIINEAISDNIGPFGIENGGWCGGNHLFLDEKTKTAETFSVKIYADDQPIHCDTTLVARNIRVEVKNNIFNPLSAVKNENKVCFTDTLCVERVIYTIIDNNIQVDLSHNYTNTIPVVISRYYGMQSMFNGERQILTPLGKYDFWTDINKVSEFKKGCFPQFNRYIEKNEFCFQSSFLFNENLGTHKEVADDDVVFIGNSWSKSYHKLIGNVHRVAGNSDLWRGVYTWFTTPLLDTESAFAYEGFINGKKAVFFSNNVKGVFTVQTGINVSRTKINIIEKTQGIKIKKRGNTLCFCCKAPGSAIVSFEK